MLTRSVLTCILLPAWSRDCKHPSAAGHLFLAHTRCAAIQVALSSTLPNTLATGAIDYLLTSELALPLPAARPAFYSDHTEQVGAPPC